MHADPDPVRIDAEEFPRGHELPGVADRLTLEVVPERKIAQHLEEGMVPLGEPDLLEVVVLAAGPDDLLAGGGPAVLPLFLAQKDPLELDHSRIGEQQRGIVFGLERGGRHLPVPPRHEEVEERSADDVRTHAKI